MGNMEKVRKVVLTGLFAAMAVLLSGIHFPGVRLRSSESLEKNECFEIATLTRTVNSLFPPCASLIGLVLIV